MHTPQEAYLFQETHIMHVFEDDFYGSELRVVMLGYIRGEKNFKSLGESCPQGVHVRLINKAFGSTVNGNYVFEYLYCCILLVEDMSYKYEMISEVALNQFPIFFFIFTYDETIIST